MKKIILVLVLVVLATLTGCDKEYYLAEGFGVTSDVLIENLSPGQSATGEIKIHNGHDKDRQFYISLNSPHKITDGYEPIPAEYLDWFIIEQPELSLSKGETGKVRINLAMPEGIEYPNKKMEVRVRVSDMSQTGLVQVALESEWYITTR